MKDVDKREFKRALDETMEFFGKPAPQVAMLKKWWKAFGDWTLREFEAALEEHERRAKFAPMPADLFELRDLVTGRPSADEAWAIALVAMDEAETVILPEEALKAFSVASEVMASGDKVAARMAFKSAYERECANSRGRVKWRVSLGHDANRREQAIRDAVDQGRLTHEQASKHLPLPPPTEAGKAIAGLLTGNVSHMPQDEKTKERLAELKRMISASRVGQSDKHEQKQKARDALVAKKQEIIRQVESRTK